MTLPSLEIHVPISPTPHFFNMVRCLAGSLRRFGGAYRNAPLIVTVGDEEIDEGLEFRWPWLREQGVELRWVPPDLYRRESWFATGLERFRYDFGSDVVLMLDADVLIRDSFGGMVCRVDRDQALAGLIAHTTPFYRDELWQLEGEICQELYDRCGLGPVSLSYEYTAWKLTRQGENIHSCRHCPPYFNFGVLSAPGRVMNQIGEVIYELTHQVNGVLETDFRCQLALSLAVVQLDLPYWTLPLRYNFPTGQGLETVYPEEAEAVKIIHLLGRRELEKRTIYSDRRSVEKTVKRADLSGVDETARRVLASVVDDLADERQAVEW